MDHADAVVLGEAEPLWPRVVEDLGRGRLDRVYRGRRRRALRPAAIAGPAVRPVGPGELQPHPDPDLARLSAPLRVLRRVASFGPGYRQKTVDQVLGEIRAVGEIWERPFLEFADDNLFVDRRWGRELLRAAPPAGLRWFAETDISIADAPDLLQALRPAGCYQLLIGLESLSRDNLAAIESTGWKAGRLDRYVQAVRTIQDAGVTVNTCFIVGLDHDTPAVFDDIRRFVRQAEPLEIQVTVLTPFPGTPLFKRLRREGRLDEPPFWHKCTLFDVNYRPSGMSREELRRGLYDLFRDLYNEEAFARRQRQYMDLIHKLRRRENAALPAG